MADIEEILRLNPKAAAETDSIRLAIEALNKLREAGLAGKEALLPFGRRQSINDLKQGRRSVVQEKIQNSF
jgi:hypothetical protein